MLTKTRSGSDGRAKLCTHAGIPVLLDASQKTETANHVLDSY